MSHLNDFRMDGMLIFKVYMVLCSPFIFSVQHYPFFVLRVRDYLRL